MTENCKKWYKQLHDLRILLAEYLEEYTVCEQQKDFLPLKSKKEGIQTLLNHIRPLNAERKHQLNVLHERLKNNPKRHREIFGEDATEKKIEEVWSKIFKKLRIRPKLIDSLIKMEESGGEPDLVWYDSKKNKYAFVDCSQESPQFRRRICYDKDAQRDARDLNLNPVGNAIDTADSMGIQVLTQEQYWRLQELDDLDLNSHSWLITPKNHRDAGRALYGDKLRKNEKAHISFDSAMAVRENIGFRGILEV